MALACENPNDSPKTNEQNHPTKKLTGPSPRLLAEKQLQSYSYSCTSVCSFGLHLAPLRWMALSRCVGVTRCFHVAEPFVSIVL